MRSALLLFLFRSSASIRVRPSQIFQNQSMKSWDETLQKYLDKVSQVNGKGEKLVARVHKYAEKRLSEHHDAILANLHANGIEALDLLWPGAGYASVAAGGQYEVLSVLRKAGILDIGRIMGASGGAASAFLALADADGGTDTLLTYYMAYAAWLKDNPITGIVGQGILASPLWSAIYRRLLKDESVFERMKRQAWVVSSCGQGSQNSVMHNFGSEDQCVEAYYSSGNASLQGATVGTFIPGNDMFSRLGGTCGDGGKVTFFPDSSTPLIYYRTKYSVSDFMLCSKQSIERLFKNGVDQTISLLTSSGLLVMPNQKNKGGMVIVQPAPGGKVGSEEFDSQLKPFLDEGQPWSPTSGCTYFFDIVGDSTHYTQNC